MGETWPAETMNGLYAMGDPAIIIDNGGKICAANPAWLSSALYRQNPLEHAVGCNFLWSIERYCDCILGIDRVLNAEVKCYKHQVTEPLMEEDRPYVLQVEPVCDHSRIVGALVIYSDAS